MPCSHRMVLIHLIRLSLSWSHFLIFSSSLRCPCNNQDMRCHCFSLGRGVVFQYDSFHFLVVSYLSFSACVLYVRRKIYLSNHSQLLLMKTGRMIILSKLEMCSYLMPAPGGQATIPFLAPNHSRAKMRSSGCSLWLRRRYSTTTPSCHHQNAAGTSLWRRATTEINSRSPTSRSKYTRSWRSRISWIKWWKG